MSGFVRRSASTAALLVLALLVASAQHSLRLCRFSEHASAPALAGATDPACPEHAAPTADEQAPDEGRVPPCCGPSVVLVSIPSLKGVASTEVAPTHVFVNLESASAGGALVAALGALQLAVDSNRRNVPYPHLRPNLALRTILV